MSEARKRILQMLADGKITVEQSEELLGAVAEDLNKQTDTGKTEKIGAEMKKVAHEVKTQVTEAFKKVEPHTKEIKSKLKELGGWIQGTVKGMMDDFSFSRMGPRDGLDVDFQVPEPEGFSVCRECEVHIPHGSVIIKAGDTFHMAVRGKISKSALEEEAPQAWFKSNLLKCTGSKFFLGFEKAASYKAVLHIEMTIPARVLLTVSSVSADVQIKGTFQVKGVSTVSGDVALIEASIADGSLETVSGDVQIEDAMLTGKAKSTSGDFCATRTRIGNMAVQTVSGDILLECCQVDPEAKISLASTSGDVKIKKPSGDIGDVEAATRTGDIQQEWGEVTQERPHELKLRVKERGTSIHVETVSGDISFH